MHIGHNWQSDNIVLGIEADFTLADTQSEIQMDLNELDQFAATDMDFISTLRGRTGFTTGDLLFYGTAGVALGRLTNEKIDFDPNPNGLYVDLDTDDSFVDERTDLGWVIGAGAEARISDNWRIRLECQYSDFGNSRNFVNQLDDGQPLAFGEQQFDVSNDVYSIRLGFSLGF